MKVWFITGASRGFGALMTKEALASGDAVIATARNPKTVTEQFDDHPNLLAVALDVTNEAQAKEAAAAGIARFGRIDVLANNAGYGLLGAVEEATAEEIERLYATNVFDPEGDASRAALYAPPALRPHPELSSIGGYFGYPGWGVYGSTKFAVEGLSESMAAELEPFGIKVTIVEPGFFRTDFLADTSLAISPASIADYEGTPAGNMRSFAADANHAQPGNPARLATGIMTMVNSANPPLRMPFGSDTVAMIEQQHASVEKELATWRQLALSTDFPSDATTSA